ncbi:hypothetical protein ACO0K0_07915 [Undibacterium sp. SXout11W]|uniref:hypothetical protein n=1 Tax=Undibacterium sp. SXout11W TaxID=3413050 RepID=UPI003BEFD86F
MKAQGSCWHLFSLNFFCKRGQELGTLGEDAQSIVPDPNRVDALLGGNRESLNAPLTLKFSKMMALRTNIYAVFILNLNFPQYGHNHHINSN